MENKHMREEEQQGSDLSRDTGSMGADSQQSGKFDSQSGSQAGQKSHHAQSGR